MEKQPRPSSGLWAQVGKVLTAAVKHLRRLPHGVVGPRRDKRLHLRETLSLGEKRFLAVIEFQRQEFLVGGTGTSIALLARLNAGPAPADAPVPSDTRRM